MNRPRAIATLIHRWTGLAMALFLTIVGLTGAMIVWNDQLERFFAPSMFVLPVEAQHRAALDVFTLREAAEREMGYAVNGVDWTRRPDEPALFSLSARPGRAEPHDDQIALDPSTARLLGRRRQGDLSQGLINLMPFIYSLHESLALGETGRLILGVVALFWTIDCFIGAYLTFPAKAEVRRTPEIWMRRWKPSWKIRPHAGRYKLFYDLHRAGGLWPWALFAILAWSSVSFNLDPIYRPVMAATFGMAPEPLAYPRADARLKPGLDWRAAHALAQHEMAELSKREHFEIISERLLLYNPTAHSYAYRVLSSRDPGDTGNTQIIFDADNGAIRDISIPTGEYAGTTITAWIGDIHTGNVLGLTMRVLLTLVGLAVVMLSMTGVWLWWRKRSGRRKMRRGHSSDRGPRRKQLSGRDPARL